MHGMGLITSSIIIPAILLDAGLRIRRWSFLNYVGLYGGIIFYVMAIIIYPIMWDPISTDIFGVVTEVFDLDGIMCIVIGLAVSTLPRFTLHAWKSLFYPEEWQPYMENRLGY